MISEETRKKLSDSTKKLWANPKFREAQMNRVYSEETRKRMSESAKRKCQRPETILRMSIETKTRMQDPEVRKALSIKAKKQWECKELKRQAAEKANRQWSDPEYKKMMFAILNKNSNQWSDSKSAKMSQALKRRWKNPEFRNKMEDALSKGQGGYGKREWFDRYLFRSSWEVKFAKRLVAAGIKYFYEPQRFKLSNHKTYCPDFFLEDRNLWVEIKGLWKPGSKDKFDLFKIEYPQHKIIVLGSLKEIEGFSI